METERGKEDEMNTFLDENAISAQDGMRENATVKAEFENTCTNHDMHTEKSVNGGKVKEGFHEGLNESPLPSSVKEENKNQIDNISKTVKKRCEMKIEERGLNSSEKKEIGKKSFRHVTRSEQGGEHEKNVLSEDIKNGVDSSGRSSEETVENNTEEFKNCRKNKINRIYECRECGKTFKTHSEKRKHVSEQHKLYLCPYKDCLKTFKERALREKHVNSVHLDIRIHQCYKCAKMFKTESAFKVHLYSVHTDAEKKEQYICNICNKVFYQAGRLHTHKSVHTGEKMFKCTVEDCGKAFR